MAIGIGLSDQLEELCSSNNTDGEFQQALNELYSRSDSFYCNTNCGCYVGPTVYVTGKINSSHIDTTLNTNVQDCRTFLEAAYAGYNIDFDDIDDIIKYLDLFGEIEKEYECSGICTTQTVYYFGDASKGKLK